MLTVISGPSGCGKTTILRSLLADPRVRRVVTATTRQPRPGEVHGRDYWFLTEAAFEELRASGGLLESADNFGCFYGTPRSEVERPGDPRKVILDLDPQGFRALRKTNTRVFGIFVAPPSLEVLKERLRARGTETADQVERRLARAAADLAAASEYDAVVVNDRLEDAVSAIKRHLGLSS
jgi:guanylate kinase